MPPRLSLRVRRQPHCGDVGSAARCVCHEMRLVGLPLEAKGKGRISRDSNKWMERGYEFKQKHGKTRRFTLVFGRSYD